MRRKAILAILVILAVATFSANAIASQDSALAAVRATKGALDAKIDDRGNLWVMVIKNNQVAWDQYAGYMCAVVRPHQARIFITHIVDITSVGGGKKPGEWKQLAAAKCSN